MMNDVQRILPKCPKCGRYYSEHPAISRKDNKTEICPSCGLIEALEVLELQKKKNKLNSLFTDFMVI